MLAASSGPSLLPARPGAPADIVFDSWAGTPRSLVTVAVSLVLGDGVSDLLAGEVLSRIKPALPAHLLLSSSPRPATTAGGSGPVVPILLFWRLDGRYKDLVNQIVLRLSELAPPGTARNQRTGCEFEREAG